MPKPWGLSEGVRIPPEKPKPLEELRLAELGERVELAEDMLRALCEGTERWRDLVIGRGINAGDEAIRRLRRLDERHPLKGERWIPWNDDV